jgi:hypothetical protein
VLCCAVQLDITKSWVDMHHPRSPRVTYFDALFRTSTGQKTAAGDVWEAALQYARNASHQQAVSGCFGGHGMAWCGRPRDVQVSGGLGPFDALLGTSTEQKTAAGDVWEAALQYTRNVSHQQAVSGELWAMG